MPISRRKILSQSREDLSATGQDGYNPYEEDEDVWYSKDKLFKDHIAEILQKWEKIDDEIWAKLICMERNRRVAKAYARAPILTINGSDEGFDGYRIGMNGFVNPMRDPKTEETKRLIGQGVKIKMDDSGNILIKRLSKAPVIVRHWSGMDEADVSTITSMDSSVMGPAGGTALSAEIIKAGGQLEIDKPFVLFDMKKFTGNVQKELLSAYPDRKRLEAQCISCIAFARDSADILNLPCWVMLINIVAMDMLRSKLVPVIKKFPSPKFVTIFDSTKEEPENQMILMKDEDPYSISVTNSAVSIPFNVRNGNLKNGSAGYGYKMDSTSSHSSGGSSGGGGGKNGQKPPELPPRDLDLYEALKIKRLSRGTRGGSEFTCCPTPTPDYEPARYPGDRKEGKRNKPKAVPDWRDEDPYYCGMRARVPNYVKNPQRSTSTPPSRLHTKAMERVQSPEKGVKGSKMEAYLKSQSAKGGSKSASKSKDKDLHDHLQNGSSSRSSSDSSATRVPFAGYLGNFFFSDRKVTSNHPSGHHNSTGSSSHYHSLYGSGSGNHSSPEDCYGASLHSSSTRHGHSSSPAGSGDLYSNYRRVRHSQELFCSAQNNSDSKNGRIRGGGGTRIRL